MSNPTARPIRALLLLAVLAILTLGACSGGIARANEPAGGGSVTPDDPISGSPVPIDPWPMDPPFPNDGATHVTPVPGVTDGRAHAIDHISVAADGVTVTVYWWGGVEACYALQKVTVTYDENGTPTITVFEGSNANLQVDMACIDLAMLKATTITLDHPLFADGASE